MRENVMEGDNGEKIYLLLDISGVLIRDGEANQELIDYLMRRKEICSYALLTNLSGDIEKVLMDQYGIPKFYHECVTSSDAGYAKPHPKIFELVLARVGVKPKECIFVDDTEENVQAARLFGMKGIVYRSFEAFKKEFEEML